MAFKIDMDDLKARAKARASSQKTAHPEQWLTAKAANVAKTANDTPEVLAKLATLAGLAISQQPKEGGEGPDSLAKLATLAGLAISHAPEAVAKPPAEPTQADAAKVAAVVNKGTRYALRVERFARLGLSGGDAEALAQRLAWRDQDMDHRTACAECQNLHGRPGAWRCGNWQRAGIGAPAVPGAFVLTMLQHCPGFKRANC